MEEQKEQNFYRTILLNDQNDEIKNHQQALVRMDQQNSQKNIANNNNKSGSVFLIEQIVKCFFIISLSGAGAFVFYKTPIYFSTLEAITFGVSKFQEQKLNYQQQRVETLQDWEKMFGLDSFQEVNDQSYTQEDLDAVFKQMKIFWNPNKKNKFLSNVYSNQRKHKNILKYHIWQ